MLLTQNKLVKKTIDYNHILDFYSPAGTLVLKS